MELTYRVVLPYVTFINDCATIDPRAVMSLWWSSMSEARRSLMITIILLAGERGGIIDMSTAGRWRIIHLADLIDDSDAAEDIDWIQTHYMELAGNEG